MQLPFYRLHTNLPGFKLFDVKLSERYRKVLKQAEDHKMPELAKGVTAIPEFFHTPEMLEEGFVCEADDQGIIDTTDKEIAKAILRQLKALGPAKYHKNIERGAVSVAYLDPNSPQDIIDELKAEAEAKATPKAMQAALEERYNSLKK